MAKDIISVFGVNSVIKWLSNFGIMGQEMRYIKILG